MRRIFFIAIMMSVLPMTVALADPPEVGVSFGVFYNSLGPYGEWLHVNGGVYAWRPLHVDVGWRPYTYGQWVWTDDGWFWASDEPWGWATCHYGRWYYDDYYGWVWIPGYEWAPAWVEWRYGGGCIGWAPLSPYALFSVGIGIHYTHHWVTPVTYWNFVDCRYINRPRVHDFVYRSNDNSRWFGRTRDGGNIRVEGTRIVSRGPERDYVERTGNVRIQRTDVTVTTDRVGERRLRGSDGRERIEVYRPQVTPGTVRGEVERPTRVRPTDRPISIDVQRTDVDRRTVTTGQQNVTRKSDEFRVRESESTRQAVPKQDRVRTAPPPDRSRVQGQRETRVDRREVGKSRGATRSPEGRAQSPRNTNPPRERTGNRR